MLKLVTKIIFILFLGIVGSFFLVKSFASKVDHPYKQVLFTDKNEIPLFIKYLESEKKIEYFGRSNADVPINTYTTIKNLALSEVIETIDERDYRFTPYLKSIGRLFENSAGEIVYINIGHESVFGQAAFYFELYNKGFNFKILDSEFLRQTLCLLVLLLSTFIFAIGSKSRFVLSVLVFVSYIFIPKNDPYFFMLFLIAIYFLIILIVENLSLSNRYIRRNDLGLVRVCMFIAILFIPSVAPYIINMEYSVLNTVFIDNNLSYDVMEDKFNKDNPDISNLFTHYAYQYGVLYGCKYLFPTCDSSVKINEFEGVEHSLALVTKDVVIFDEAFLKSFKENLESTTTGNFFSSFNGLFVFEVRQLASLYIREKEYMQICIFAVIMLLSFLLFKKKVVKY